MFGVCYYPEHWSENQWASDAQRMVNLGLHYVRIGEFAWSRLEPERDQYAFEWMDRAIDTLGAAGLKVIIGTPTATPPKWLIDEHPEILPNHPKTGRSRGFGSRRHYDFSSEIYLEESLRITRKLAQRYGRHPSVVGWQTDNELCCHDTTLSVSPAAKRAFQGWCKQRYGSIHSLNEAWGNVFWSMEYPDFPSIECPFGAVTETSPAHQLAFRRFSSDQVVRYHSAMVAALREHAQDQFITHNFIPMHETGVDNHALAAPLDFASYDNYPLGRTDLIMAKCSAEELIPYMRTGHPDYATYYHDQTRGLLDRGFWIMEQQPGPVNWANSNPRPLPGMIRFWTLEAFAHGAECVSYFRWRQIPFAQEQMHAGLLRNDSSESEYLPEIRQVVAEVQAMGLTKEQKTHSRIAILNHAQSNWISDIERQSQFFETDTIQRDYYCALRQLGLDVDFIDEQTDFNRYALIIAPSMPMLSKALLDRIEKSSTTFVFGPRTGSKTNEFSLPHALPPGELQRVLPFRVLSTETTRPDCPEHLVWKGNQYQSVVWREFIDAGHCGTIATMNGTHPAVLKYGQRIYIATLTCSRFLVDFFEDLCQSLNLATFRCPDGVRIARRGGLTFAFNYSSQTQSLEIAREGEFVLGGFEVAPRDVAAWRTASKM